MPTSRKRRSPTAAGRGEFKPEPGQELVKVDARGITNLLKALHEDSALAKELSVHLGGARPSFELDLNAGTPAFHMVKDHFEKVSSFVDKKGATPENLDLGTFFACDPNDPFDFCWGPNRST